MTAAPDEDGLEEDASTPAFEIPNASDEKQVRRRQDRALREEEEAKAFWRAVFASPIGRREMWRLLEAGHPFEERFATPDKPREATWVLAGEQRLAFRIFREWERRDLDGATLMRRENDPWLRQ